MKKNAKAKAQDVDRVRDERTSQKRAKQQIFYAETGFSVFLRPCRKQRGACRRLFACAPSPAKEGKTKNKHEGGPKREGGSRALPWCHTTHRETREEQRKKPGEKKRNKRRGVQNFAEILSAQREGGFAYFGCDSTSYLSRSSRPSLGAQGVSLSAGEVVLPLGPSKPSCASPRWIATFCLCTSELGKLLIWKE